MARFYSYEWRDGKAFLADIEPDVDAEIIDSGGEPIIQVTGLFIDGIDILRSPSPTVQLLACEIKAVIEADMEWCAARCKEEGWTYKTLGGNDPDARWQRPKMRQSQEWEVA